MQVLTYWIAVVQTFNALVRDYIVLENNSE